MNESTGREIYVTDELGIFQLDERNRPLKPSKVARMIKSISRKNQLARYPILVSKTFVVEDGQHRLAACRKLGLRIYYTFSPDEDTDIMDVASAAMSQDRWSSHDVLHHYIQISNPHYMKVRQIMEDNPHVSLASCLSIMRMDLSSADDPEIEGSYGRIYEIFRDGKLEVSEEKENMIRDVADLSLELQEFAPYCYYDRSFLIALARMMSNPLFDRKRLLDQFKKKGDHISRQAGTDGYLRSLQAVYNRGRHLNNITWFIRP